MVLLTNFPPPDQGIQLIQGNTSVNIDGKDLGSGTFFITESCVAWQKETDGKGFCLRYPAISCHAISRDLVAFPHECLYLMTDGKMPGSDSEQEEDDDDDDGDEESDADLSEIRIVPEDKDMLEAMFAAVSNCQMLHPDPEDMDSEDEAFAEAFADCEEFVEEDEQNGYEEEPKEVNGDIDDKQSGLEHLGAVLHIGQGDAPSSSTSHVSASENTGTPGAEEDSEPMEASQFQDAEEME